MYILVTRLISLKKLIYCLLLIGILFFSAIKRSLSQVTYNVTPNGTGVTSLVGAKNDIRNTGVNASSDVVVSLSDGTYFLNEPLVFNEKDGGQSHYSVTYKAAPGANPVISGGKLITDWEISPDNEKLYRARFDGTSFRNLYINGRRARRAKGSSVSGVKVFEENGVKVGIVFNKTDIDRYKNLENVEINYTRAWRDYYFLVESIEDVSYGYYLVRIKNFKYCYASGYTAIAPGQPAGPLTDFYFENALELLDQPGEWYYDKTDRYIYYYPFEVEDMNSAEVIIPNIEELVQIKATTLSEKVKNLNFEGISFSHNDWKWPSVNGFYSGQASAISGFGAPEFKLPGIINVDGATNIRFNNNIFQHVGSSGINIYNNTDSVFIESNSFIDISATAVSVAWKMHAIIDPGKGEGLVDHTFIRNNYVEKIGAEFKGSPGIESFYASNVIIDHNELYDLPYSGISVGWGWSPALTTTKNVFVTKNRITGVIQKANDGAGIYSLSNFGGENGLVIEGNVIDELTLPPSSHHEGAIYTDEKSGNVSIKNNIVKSKRKWFYYNIALNVDVDSMYVSSSVTNFGGNNADKTEISVNKEHIWLLPNEHAQAIEDSVGIENNKKPPLTRKENIALNKSSFSSSKSDSSSNYGNDGSLSSAWNSDSEHFPWWYVDLGATFQIENIDIITNQQATDEELRSNFVIEASNSPTFPQNETIIIHTQTGPYPLKLGLELEYKGTNAYRYVRIRKTHDNEQLMVGEIRIYGTFVSSFPNVALNKPAQASSFYLSNRVTNANDDSESSFYRSGSRNEPWWYVDLGNSYVVDAINFIVAKGEDYIPEYYRNFVIEASNVSSFPVSDTESLYIQNESSLPPGFKLVLRNPASKPYRYVRIRKTLSGEHLAVTELRVFGALTTSLTNPIAQDNKSEISFFPNPARDHLFLSYNGDDESVRIQLISIDGSAVWVKKQEIHSGETLNIETKGLRAGIYVLNVSGEKINISHKFQKVD